VAAARVRDSINGEACRKLGDLLTNFLLHRGVADVGEDFRDTIGDEFHLRFLHARVVTEGLPSRMPPAFMGGRGSKGMAFLLTVMPARSSAFSASLPVVPRGMHLN